jgi:hypothetical protein
MFGRITHVPPAPKSQVGPKLAGVIICAVVKPLAAARGLPEPTPDVCRVDCLSQKTSLAMLPELLLLAAMPPR